MGPARIFRFGFTFIAMLGMLFGTLVAAAHAQGVGGNEYCPEPLLEVDGGKIDTVDGVTEYSTPNGVVTFWLLPDKGLMFESTLGIDAVVVKGGNAANTYYFEEALSGGPLYAPINASGTPAGVSNVRFCYDPDPVEDNEWCSPGFWRNNTTMWPASVPLNTKYFDVLGTLYVTVKGVTSPYTAGDGQNTTLLQVLQNPQIFGGYQFNLVGDYLSGMHPDVNFTGDRYRYTTNELGEVVEYHVCPLEGDGNAG